MKASELRIGNLVYDTKGEINTVCVETFMKFNYQINPIPLTEEWLLKFGFGLAQIDRIISNYSIQSLSLNFYNTEIERGMWLRFYHGNAQIKIQYLHQLQNLYFALTGEELKISK